MSGPTNLARVEALWRAHQNEPPPPLGESGPDGVDLAGLVAQTTSCVEHYLASAGVLDYGRVIALKQCYPQLYMLDDIAPVETRPFVDRICAVARLILEDQGLPSSWGASEAM
ncbi:MAG TPA: hypothetical protein VLT17_09875 [Gemmatimonadales bacterium]|nr:hypothetical protein [Gemmatimonadales bacterium]